MWIENTHEPPTLIYVICSWYSPECDYLLLFRGNAEANGLLGRRDSNNERH